MQFIKSIIFDINGCEIEADAEFYADHERVSDDFGSYTECSVELLWVMVNDKKIWSEQFERFVGRAEFAKIEAAAVERAFQELAAA